jgi:hypothetical protein
MRSIWSFGETDGDSVAYANGYPKGDDWINHSA